MMHDQEKLIARIRGGRSIGASTDDLYDAIVNQDGIDENTFFLCFSAALILDTDYRKSRAGS